MFGFGKKKKKQKDENTEQDIEDKKKNKRHTHADKIVMGAILGVAIGSVVSVSLAPKKKKNKKLEGKMEKHNQLSARENFNEEEIEDGEIIEDEIKAQKKFGFFKKKEKNKEAALAKKLKKIPNEFE